MTMMMIDEDRVGEGTDLVFPNMSSCAAGIAIVGNNLVGGHFTLDVTGEDPKTGTLVGRMRDVIGDRVIDHFLIIGFNANHNPAAIRDLMGIEGNGVAKAYDLSKHVGRLKKLKPGATLYLFASAAGAGGLPTVRFKRASKVQVTKEEGWFDKWGAHGGYEADVAADNLHGLRRHFTNL